MAAWRGGVDTRDAHRLFTFRTSGRKAYPIPLQQDHPLLSGDASAVHCRTAVSIRASGYRKSFGTENGILFCLTALLMPRRTSSLLLPKCQARDVGNLEREQQGSTLIQ